MSEQLTNHQQIKEKFDQIAEKAKLADEKIGSIPRDHEGIYHTHSSPHVLQHEGLETLEKGGLHNQVTTAFDGRQIRAHVSEPGLDGRMVDSHSYERPEGQKVGRVEEGREGTHTRLYTHDREGNPKKL